VEPRRVACQWDVSRTINVRKSPALCWRDAPRRTAASSRRAC
jgi:hypothetical protein